MNRSVRKWSVAILMVIVVSILCQWYVRSCPFSFRYVHTPSIPVGLYLSRTYRSSDQVKDKEYVCFNARYPKWAADRLTTSYRPDFCKQVLGIPGDRVYARGSERIRDRNGVIESLGFVLDTDQEGRQAYPADIPSTPIPSGMFWAAGLNHPRSFDSRYFGLVPDTAIKSIITPLF